MNKTTNIFERILQIIAYYRINSINSFAKDFLKYNSSEKINRLKDEKNKPSYDILIDISSKFEDINPEWLLTGKGTMLRTGAPDSPQTQGVRGGELPALELEIETLKKENARLSELLEAKNEIIELLRGRK